MDIHPIRPRRCHRGRHRPTSPPAFGSLAEGRAEVADWKGALSRDVCAAQGLAALAGTGWACSPGALRARAQTAGLSSAGWVL